MSSRPLALVLCGWLSWAVLGPAPGRAHPLDPALLELWESGDGAVEVLWRLPASQPTDASLRPVPPGRCTQMSSPNVSENGSYLTRRWRLTCGVRSLVGERVGVEGLQERRTEALLRVHLADGRVAQAVLRGDSPFFTVPPRAGPLDVVHDYLALGLDHILTGPDHLLFVLGLVLLVRGRRWLLWTITAFTVGHSVTLSLAVLGFVHIPPRPVEALIACSIFAVAVELTREAQGRPLWVGRAPWAMAGAFGLLHGLGFAGALAQIGLPTHEIPLALFSFNGGIEVGQLLFVALVLGVRAVFRSLPVRWPKTGVLIPAYAIGSFAAFWVFERVAAIFSSY